jgi:hypothetical protein
MNPGMIYPTTKLGIGERSMAPVLNEFQKRGRSAPALNELTLNALTDSKTLEEIRAIVTSNGCTKAQFDRAKEAVGSDPHHVAMYLQRYAFKSATK